MYIYQSKIYIITFSFICLLLMKCDIKARKVFINSIPKSGTHLLYRCISLMTNKKGITWIPGYTVMNMRIKQSFNSKKILAGHAIYIPQNIRLLYDNQFINFFIYRDPRDQIVSMAHWVLKHIETRPQCSDLSLDEIIMELISKGEKVYSTNHFEGEKAIYTPTGILEYYSYYIPWMKEKNVYTTTFEKLIGPRGGGTKKEQYQEIHNIALHLKIRLSAIEIKKIAEKMFGNTATYRVGCVGSWKKEFTQEHKKKFKKIAGQLLIDLGYEKDFSW